MGDNVDKPIKFKVYCYCSHCGAGRDSAILEFPPGTSEQEIEEACEDAVKTLVNNNTVSGWNEL